jgi:hypothetical protein
MSNVCLFCSWTFKLHPLVLLSKCSRCLVEEIALAPHNVNYRSRKVALGDYEENGSDWPIECKTRG